MYTTHNPSTGQTEKTYNELADYQSVLSAVTDGFSSWRNRSVSERAEVLRSIGDHFDSRAEELAAAITTEMGKRRVEALGEVKLAASIYRWYGENGPDLLDSQSLDVGDSSKNIVTFEPVGPLIGVMPWNFPYYQVARFAAPNLMLGNTIMLKHAGICARSSALIESIQREAGLPNDAYVNVYASTDMVSDIIAEQRVRGVSLTGSERAGAAVAQVAGKNLTKSVLELGGSDPLIVLDSTDVKALVKTLGQARLSNCGQACNSPKRMFVPRSMYDEFLSEMTSMFNGLTVGPADEESTDLGPLSSESARDGVIEQVQKAASQGATIETGGHAIDRPGAYMQPTIITGITADMNAYSEEVFGPVAMIYAYDDIDEAVHIANDTSFGLSGSVWSDDLEKAKVVANRLEVGMAYVNEHGTTRAGLPFGGVGRSGYGRELAQWGMEEFVNVRLLRVH